MTSGNAYGVYIAKDRDIGPAGDEDTHLASADTGGVDVLVILDQAVSGGSDVVVYTHPLSPEGTYYPAASCVAMATGLIAAGECAIMLHHENRPCNVFGITVVNNDSITHNYDVVLYGKGGS